MTTIEQARDTVRRAVLGELRRDSDEFRTAVAAFPQLLDEVAPLFQIQHELDLSSDDAASVAVAASQLTTWADRRLVRDTVPGAPRKRRGWLVLLAAAVTITLVLVLSWPAGERDSGMLGGGQEAPAQVLDGNRMPRCLTDLVSPDGCHFELWVDGARAGTYEGPSPPTEVPAAWMLKIATATRAQIHVLRPEGMAPVELQLPARSK